MKGWMQMGLALLFWATALQAQEAAAPKDPAPSTTAPAEASTPNGATKQSEQPPAEPSEVPEPAPEEAVEPKVLKPSTSEFPASPAPNPAVAEPPASPAPPAGPDSTPAPDAKGVPEAPASGPTGPGAVAGEVGEPAGVPTDQAAGEAANPAEPAPAAAEEKTEPEKPLEAALLVLDPVGGGLSAEQSREYGRYFREQLAQEGGLPPLRPLREQQSRLIEHPSQCQGLDCGAVLGRQLNVREVLVLQLESWEDPGWGTRHRLRATHVDLKGPSKGWWEVTFRDSLNKAYDPVEELAEAVAQALGDGTATGTSADPLGGLGELKPDRVDLGLYGDGHYYLYLGSAEGRHSYDYVGTGFVMQAHWGNVSLLASLQQGRLDEQMNGSTTRPIEGTCSGYDLLGAYTWYTGAHRDQWFGSLGMGYTSIQCQNRFKDTGESLDLNSQGLDIYLGAGYRWDRVVLGMLLPGSVSVEVTSETDGGFTPEELYGGGLYLGFSF